MKHEQFPTIPGYRIVRRIGEGSFGVIYAAKREDNDALVVLKLPKREALVREKVIKRFMREGRIGSELSHPHILPARELRRWESTYFIEMEYVDGQPLAFGLCKPGPPGAVDALDDSTASFNDGDPYSPAEVVQMGARVAEALDYAHAHSILHRDVKPANILVRGDGHPMLLDFGLARRLDSESNITSSQDLFGSLAYMPPEQVRGRWKEVDHRSDLYALGVTLYQTLSGRLPFASGDFDEMRDLIVYAEPPPLPDELIQALPGVDLVLMKAMEKRREDRYQSGRELSEALESVASNGAHGVSWFGIRWRQGLRGLVRQRAKLVAAILVVVITTALWFYLDKLHEEDERRQAEWNYGMLQVQREIEDGELESARRLVDEMKVIDADNPVGHVLLAGGYARYGLEDELRRQLALAALKGFAGDGSKLESGLDYHAYGLKLVFVDKQWEQGIRALEHALELDEKNQFGAWYPLYWLHKADDPARARDALTAYKQRLTLGDDLTTIIDCQLLELDDENQQVVDRLHELLAKPDVDAHKLRIHRMLGRVQLALEHYPEAAASLLAAVEAAPGDASSWINLSELPSMGSTDVERAQEYARRAAQVSAKGRTYTEALARLAWLAVRQLSMFVDVESQRELRLDAVRGIEELRYADTTHAMLPALEADLLFLERGLDGLDCVLELYPDHYQALTLRAQVHWFYKRYPEALIDLHAARAAWDAELEAPARPLSSDPRWLFAINVWTFAAAAWAGAAEDAHDARVVTLTQLAEPLHTTWRRDALNFAEFLAIAPAPFQDCTLAQAVIEQQQLDQIERYPGPEAARKSLEEITNACAAAGN